MTAWLRERLLAASSNLTDCEVTPSAGWASLTKDLAQVYRDIRSETFTEAIPIVILERVDVSAQHLRNLKPVLESQLVHASRLPCIRLTTFRIPSDGGRR
jgi:hypothetical protein